ncbi:hypothetical protein D3C78_893940 [compost metagenome]
MPRLKVFHLLLERCRLGRRCTVQQLLGQVGQFDHTALGQRYRLAQGVEQLAHIPRPRMAQQATMRLGAQTQPRPGRQAREQRIDQLAAVAALTQGR